MCDPCECDAARVGTATVCVDDQDVVTGGFEEGCEIVGVDATVSFDFEDDLLTVKDRTRDQLAQNRSYVGVYGKKLECNPTGVKLKPSIAGELVSVAYLTEYYL